jgi:hypothetical protein
VISLQGVAGDVGGVSGDGFLFDLDEEGVFAAVAFEVDAVIAKADGAGADDLEGNVYDPVLGEEMTALRKQGRKG